MLKNIEKICSHTKVNGFCLLILLSGFLQGCATTTPEQQQKWNEKTPICFDASDCKVKWAAARDWIQNNAGYKIQTYSEDLIETYNPIGTDPKLAVSVTKKPLLKDANGNVTSAIVVRIYCGNMFGCVPTLDQAITSFSNYVSNAEIADASCYLTTLKDDKHPKVGIFAPILMNKQIIKRVCSDSPAQLAGLKSNDVVRSINGIEIKTDADVEKAFKSVTFGGVVRYDIERDDKPMSILVHMFSKEKHEQLRNNVRSSNSQSPPLDAESKLESLVRMLNKGLISKEEFENKKRELLNNL